MKVCRLRKMRTIVSLVLCMALLLSGSMWNGITAVAETAGDTGVVYAADGYTVTFEIVSQWDNGYNADVTITNTGDKKIENWKMNMVLAPGTGIDSIWNALIQKETEEGTSVSYDICNPGWSRDIAPGESVSFGYQGRVGASFGEEGSYAPSECYLTGGQYDAGEQDYRLLYRMVENWESGGIVEAVIKNLTDKNMENWKLSFSWQGVRIEEIWDASMTEKDGRYFMENAGYNYTIPAKDSVAFRMKVQFDGEETAYPQDGILTYDAEGAGTKNTPEPEKPGESPSAAPPATSPAVAATEAAAETEAPEVTEEMRRWNRTMLHMDDESIQKALETGNGSVRVALLDSGVDEMEGIPVAGRVNLIPGENGMTEFYEDATGHGTAIAGLMAYHYKNEEDIRQEKLEEYNEQFYGEDAPEDEEMFPEDEETEDILSGNDGTQDVQTGGIPSGNDGTQDAQTGEEQTDEEDEEEDADTVDEEEGTGLGELIAMSQARFEGINPSMDLYSVRVLDAYNETPASRVIEGIRWAREHDIRIINISFGTSKDYEELHEEIKKAYKEGILIIAAAGNDGKKQYPAAYKEVLGVGSVDCTGHVEECCKEDGSVELSAPGEGVLSVGSFGVETEVAGTSMAAGEVTAIASILWQQNPAVSNKFIRSLLAAGANPCDDSKGYGIVDIAGSLAIYEEFQEAYEEAADVDFEDIEEDGQTGSDSTPAIPEKKEEAVSQDVDALLSRAAIEKKEEAPATTEGMLKASWGGETHLSLVEGPASQNIKIDNALMLLKIGARLQDGVLCNLNDKKKFPTWHGYFQKVKGGKKAGDANYIAGYMYLTRLAKKIYEKGVYKLGSDRAWNIVRNNKIEDLCMQGVITNKGINYDDSEKHEKLLKKNKKYYKENGIDLNNVDKSSWINIFRSNMGDSEQKAGEKDALNDDPVLVTSSASVTTKAAAKATEEQALVVYGMGLHTMTDVFAHSCKAATISSVSGNASIVWGEIVWGKMSDAKKGVLGEGKKEKYNDSTKVVPNRVVAASRAAINALNHIRYEDGKLTIDSSEVTDFYSAKSSKEKEIVQIKDYICKRNKKDFVMMPSYLEKAFAIKNFQNNIKECKKNAPDYIKNLDLDHVEEICNNYKVIFFKLGAEQTNGDVTVIIKEMDGNKAIRQKNKVINIYL